MTASWILPWLDMLALTSNRIFAWLGAGLLLLGIICAVSTLFLGGLFYRSGLLVLNPFTDRMEREFWFDPEHIDIPPYTGINPNLHAAMVAREGEIMRDFSRGRTRTYDTTIDADRAKILSLLRADEGKRLLGIFGGLFVQVGVIITSIGVALRCLGLISRPTPSPGTLTLLDIDRLGRTDQAGLLILLMGASLSFFCGSTLPAIAGEFGIDYRRGSGVTGLDAEFTWLFWPIVALDKIAYASGMIAVGGLVVIAVNGPSRRSAVFGWINRIAWGKLRYGSVSMAWANWLALLSFLVAILSITVGLFIFETVQELGVALTGDWFFLDFYENPAWLQAIEKGEVASYSGIFGFCVICTGLWRVLICSWLGNCTNHSSVRIGSVFCSHVDPYNWIFAVVNFMAFVGFFIAAGGIIWLLLSLVEKWVEGYDVALIGPLAPMAFGVFLICLQFIPLERK